MVQGNKLLHGMVFQLMQGNQSNRCQHVSNSQVRTNKFGGDILLSAPPPDYKYGSLKKAEHGCRIVDRRSWLNIGFKKMANMDPPMVLATLL